MKGISILKRPGNLNSISSPDNMKKLNKRTPYLHFDWININNLCYSKHVFFVVVCKMIDSKVKDNSRTKYKFKMSGRK